jgi:hypothetical protein
MTGETVGLSSKVGIRQIGNCNDSIRRSQVAHVRLETSDSALALRISILGDKRKKKQTDAKDRWQRIAASAPHSVEKILALQRSL